jgi:integrase
VELAVEARWRLDHALPVASTKTTVGEYLAYWLEVTRRRVRVSTYEAYALAAKRLDPSIGGERLSRLDPPKVQATYDHLCAMGLPARSVKQVHAVLHRALDQAMHWGLISRNSTEVVVPPRPIKREMTALTQEQFGRLLAATRDDRWHPLWVLLGTAGLRIGEALGLRWDDVDLEGRRLAIRRALQRQRVAGLVFIPPKTRASRRSVRLSCLACRALAEHRERQRDHIAGNASWPETSLVFPNRQGGPMESSSVTSALDRALRLAGLPRIRVHDLRHTAASVLLEAGAHPKVVQDLLRHSTVLLTLDTYSHVTDTLSSPAADMIDAMFESDGSAEPSQRTSQ